MTNPEEETRRLAGESLSAQDATGWFERLYVAALDGAAVVPWDRDGPNRLLVEWAEAHALAGGGRRALVVGAGLGADSEFVAALGFDTVAFDVSATAIQTTRGRYSESTVEYLAADLLEPPAGWRAAFELVVESLTVQSLPDSIRPAAIARVAELVGPAGRWS